MTVRALFRHGVDGDGYSPRKVGQSALEGFDLGRGRQQAIDLVAKGRVVATRLVEERIPRSRRHLEGTLEK